MRRIQIDDRIRGFADDYSTNLFKNRNKNFVSPLDRLADLKKSLSNRKYKKYCDYIDNIITYYSEINKLIPERYKEFYEEHFKILTEDQLNKTIKIKGKKMAFYEWIVWAMRYDDVRASEFIPYVNQLGIKACVYCNSQFAITVDDGTTADRHALYELDHYMPKSKYPFLCTSFYNLQPTCSCCNKTKSDDTKYEWFNLFTTHEDELDPFVFKLNDESEAKYWLSHDKKEIEVELTNSASAKDSDKKQLDSEIKKLRINEIYAQHNDAIEELLWKTRIYDDNFLQVLREEFSSLGFGEDDSEIKRFILGSYPNDEDIHKRPLAKVSQDVAKQIGLL